MYINKRFVLLLAVAASAAVGALAASKSRCGIAALRATMEHKQDLKSWENEGGNLAPACRLPGPAVTSSARGRIHPQASAFSARSRPVHGSRSAASSPQRESDIMKRALKPLLIAVAWRPPVRPPPTASPSTRTTTSRGRQFTADQAGANFGRSGFNDRVSSAVVHDGRWEICVDIEFRGSCGVLAPGAYPNLGAYAGRVSSVRPIDGRQADNRPTIVR